jgi:beta-lactamase superfamily II metal-dependent hydrolase
MSELKVTLIDVGWGDSIFLETEDSNGDPLYALIDSNDTSTLRSSYIFLRRYFDRKYAIKGLTVPRPSQKRMFEWILVTHAHADHAQGLKRLLQEFGTKEFWFPNTHVFAQVSSSPKPIFVGTLMNYVTKSKYIGRYDWVDEQKVLPNFGTTNVKVLWPPPNHNDANENNNSVVLLVTLGQVSFVLTGDTEADVWSQLGSSPAHSVASQIPSKTLFFKHPHHGSDNGMFEASSRQTPWLNVLGPGAEVGISSHVRPFSHPSPSVIDELNNRGYKYYRTDEHHHITVTTDGINMWTEYSHV